MANQKRGKIQITVYLDPDVAARLRQHAVAQGRKITAVVERALLRALPAR